MKKIMIQGVRLWNGDCVCAFLCRRSNIPTIRAAAT